MTTRLDYMRAALAIAALLLMLACARQPTPSPAFAPVPAPAHATQATGQAYAGVVLADSPEGGALVTAVVAGPAAQAGIVEGDRILYIGEHAVDAARVHALIDRSAPGTTLTLVVARGDGQLRMPLTLALRGDWLGPAAQPSDVAFHMPAPALAPSWVERALTTVAQADARLHTPSQRLQTMFDALAHDDTGFNKLPAVRYALATSASTGGRTAACSRMRKAANKGA